MIYFELNSAQEKKLNSWSKKLKKKYKADYSLTVGGAFTFSFCHTGLGTSVIVKHINGEELDLSEYDKW